MTQETFEAIELGQAEALIELSGTMSEEVNEKLDVVVAPYVEFE